MTTYGLTSTGLVVETTEIIRAAIVLSLQGVFGVSVPVGDTDLLGHLTGIFAEREGALWDLMQQVYNATDPDGATGARLDAVAALTGTLRGGASSSSVTATLCGVPGTIVPAGTQAQTLSTATVFVLQSTVTIALLQAWHFSTNYVLGQRITNNSLCYQCTVPGMSAGSGGPTGTGTSIVDGGVTWEYVGAGTGAVDGLWLSQNTGPINAVSLDLAQITTPVFGWDSILNLGNAVLGALIQTDEDLRLTRQEEIASAGTGTPPALEAGLLEVTGVTSSTVFYNDTDSTDANGLPPHSVMALVIGGADQDIWNFLFANVAAGIVTYGTDSGTVVDSQGVSHTINFQRPTQIPIYIRIGVVYDATAYPTDGDTEVATDIADWGNGQKVGKDSVRAGLSAQAFQVPGVDDVPVEQLLLYTDVLGTPVAWAATASYVATVGSRSVVTNDGGRAYICITGGTSGSTGPTGTGQAITDGTVTWWYLGNTIAISTVQIATYTNTNITVTSSAGTP
jgi:hypothetical protein